MELTYSAQKTDFDPDKRYRNPQYFDKPESGVTKVTVIGDWPNVADAYKATGVEVEVAKMPKPKKSAATKSGTKLVFAAAEGADGKWNVAGTDGKQVGEPYDTKDLAEAEAKRLTDAE